MAVHFTKQQIDEIEKALIARSKRDSQFPGADTLDGTELIPIIQNGVNKIMTYSGLWNKVAADLQEFVEKSLATKVDKVEGKELSTNDFDNDYKDKLDNIQAGAEVNVNADWTAESGDAFILHKPDLSIYATVVSVEDIKALIPNAASTSNQLADKSFVNSSIATNTAEFKGTYDTLEELMTVVANLNDYGFVRNVDSLGNVTFDKYKYTSNNTWLYEYSLNNSSFTQAQWDAINSGITEALVTKLNGIESAAQVNVIEGIQVDGSDLPITNKKANVVLSGKVDKIAGKGLSTNDYTNSEKLKLAGVETSAQVNKIEHIKINGTEQTITEKTVNLPAYPDITGKADKDTTATDGNIAVFDSSGNPVGSDMNLNGVLSPVVAAAFAKLQAELDSIKVLIKDYSLDAKAASIDALEYKIGGIPRILYSETAGAPSASNVPINWEESTMQTWAGIPMYVGQIYVDKSSKKVYFAAVVTSNTSDWVVLN